MKVESFSHRSPADPVERRELKKGQVLSVGRGPLTSRHFLGLPIHCVSPNDVRIDQSVWSRAALVLLMSRSGDLFIFDRASRNVIICESETDERLLQSFEYTPSLIVRDVERDSAVGGAASGHPRSQDSRSLDSFSFGSVVVKTEERKVAQSNAGD